LKIRPLQKLHDWLKGKAPLTEDELRRQLAHDFPLLEKIASGEVVRVGKKDFIDTMRVTRELRAQCETHRDRVKTLEDALTFYADRKHLFPAADEWSWDGGVAYHEPGDIQVTKAEDGDRARKALNPHALAASTESFYTGVKPNLPVSTLPASVLAALRAGFNGTDTEFRELMGKSTRNQ
jgi:hypothetical protein